MGGNVVKIRIYGKEYALKGQESEEYIRKIGHYIDKKMAEVSKNSVRMSGTATAILSCINVADDYFKLQDSIADIKRELDEKIKQDENLVKELNDLKTKYTETQLELAKSKSKLKEKEKSK